MNICFINYDYSIKGGAQRVAYNLIREFEKEHKVFFISVFYKNHIQAYPISRKSDFCVLVDKKSNFSKHATEILHKTRKVLVENKIDVVIVMGMAVSMTAIVSSLGLSTKTIICEHSSIYNKIYNNKVMKLNRLFACLLADKIVVLTDSCRAGYENKYYVSSKRLEVIPNWIEAELYRSPQYNLENKRIITVGRADPVKGYEKLIQVAQ